jgi:hypothetical protein
MAVTPEDVAAYLDRDGDAKTIALAGKHLPVVTALAAGYTRDQGMESEGVAAVITAATARTVQNPEGLTTMTTGPMTLQRSVFVGFTTAELAVLNRYRKRAT